MVSRNHTLPSARGLVEEGLEPVRRLVERSGISVILFHPLVSWMKKLRWGGAPGTLSLSYGPECGLFYTQQCSHGSICRVSPAAKNQELIIFGVRGWLSGQGF